MSWFFHRFPEYTDGEIDLFPIRLAPSDRELGFGREKNWRITEHGKKQEIGQICYRPGESEAIYYYGHIGYHIDAPWRGRHFAAKACRLLFRQARKHELGYVIITCDPTNIASSRTCELADGAYLETADIPEDHDMYERGLRRVMVYRFDLDRGENEDGTN